MDHIFKICALVLIVCIISLVIEKKEKDMALVLTICTCSCVFLVCVSFLRPVMDFIHSLEAISAIDSQALKIVIKVVGISALAEISSLICQDAGHSALGKAVQLSATIWILWASLPLFTKLIEIVTKIMGGI